MKSWLLSMVPCQQDIIIYHNQETSSYINQPQWLFRGSSHLSWIICRKDFSPSSNSISQGEPHTCGFGVFTPTTPTASPLLAPWFLFHAHAGCSAKGAPWLSLGSHTKASSNTQGPHSKAGRSLGSGSICWQGTQQPQVVNIWDSRYLDAHVGFGDPPVFGFDPTHETPCPPRFWRLRVQFWPRYFDEAGEKCVCGFDPRAHSISTPSPAEKIQHISLHLQRKQQNSHLSRVDDRLFKLGQNISNRTRALRSLLQPHEWGNIKECQDKGVAKIPQILLK